MTNEQRDKMLDYVYGKYGCKRHIEDRNHIVVGNKIYVYVRELTLNIIKVNDIFDKIEQILKGEL